MPRTGRPSGYSKIDVEQVNAYYLAGLTDEQVAELLGITERTLYRWLTKHPDLRHPIKTHKEEADAKVVKSLWARANGYSHQAIKFFQVGKKIIKVPYIEHYPPDPTSMIFWLKNRQPEKWKDKKEWEGKTTTEIKIEHVDIGERLEQLKRAQLCISGN